MTIRTDADARPRLFVTPNRDGTTVTWATHPAGRGQFAGSIDGAVEQAGVRDSEAVIIWNHKPPG